MKTPIASHIYKQGEGYENTLDVYLPDQPTTPLACVLYIHGGWLLWGTRKNVVQSEIEVITEAGMAYVAVDYRLAPETKVMEIAKDIQDALAWVRGEGARLYHFDPDRVAVSGKSAGGYLAMLSGTFERRPKAIVAYYGYSSLIGEWTTVPTPGYETQPPLTLDDVYHGAEPGVPTFGERDDRHMLYEYAMQTGRYLELATGYAQPNAEVEKYCPILNIDAQYPPTLLLHGTADAGVSVVESSRMHTALQGAGVNSTLRTVRDAGHGFDSAWGNLPREFGLVASFLKEQLG